MSWPADFLAALERCGDVSRAAELAGVHRRTVYKRKARRDLVGMEFAAGWALAIRIARRREVTARGSVPYQAFFGAHDRALTP